jgi:hypothetical protein
MPYGSFRLNFDCYHKISLQPSKHAHTNFACRHTQRYQPQLRKLIMPMPGLWPILLLPAFIFTGYHTYINSFATLLYAGTFYFNYYLQILEQYYFAFLLLIVLFCARDELYWETFIYNLYDNADIAERHVSRRGFASHCYGTCFIKISLHL